MTTATEAAAAAETIRHAARRDARSIIMLLRDYIPSAVEGEAEYKLEAALFERARTKASARVDGTTFIGELPGPGPWRMTTGFGGVVVCVSPNSPAYIMRDGRITPITDEQTEALRLKEGEQE